MTAVLSAADVLGGPGTATSPSQGGQRRKYPLFVFLAGSPLATSDFGTRSSVSKDSVVAFQARMLQPSTRSALLVDVGTLGRDHAATLRQVQQRSGLSWGEVARALGVSRRAVHHWTSGKRVSDRRVQRIEAFASLVKRYQRSTAALTRDALIALRPDGRSALGVFEEESRPRRSTPLSTVSVADFLDGDSTPAQRLPGPSRASRVAPIALSRPHDEDHG